VLLWLQSYVVQLLPASSSDPTALSLATLQGGTLVQINSSTSVLALAQSAGFDSIQAFMPGLQMFWDDVSAADCESHGLPSQVHNEHVKTHMPLVHLPADAQCAGQLLHVSAAAQLHAQQPLEWVFSTAARQVH
jgi:hypothetical protein